MKVLVVVSCLLAAASATFAPFAYSGVPAGFGYSTYAHHGYPYAFPYAHGYSAVPYAAPFVAPYAPVVAPALEKTQYHAQDSFGQTSYGHAEAFQKHNVVQDAAGNRAGAFSYVAPTGEVFSTKYTAGVEGYKVESNAFPVAPAETPEVVAARAAHQKVFDEVKSRSRRAAVYVAPTTYTAPTAYAATVAHPVAYSAPVAYTASTPYVAPVAHSAYTTPYVYKQY